MIRSAVLSLLLSSIILSGCASWGDNITGGALDAIDRRRDSLVLLSGRMVASARDSALSDATRKYIQALLGDITGTLNTQTTAIRDSLLGAYTLAWITGLRDDLLGDRTGRRVAALRDELIGPRTNAYLMDIREGMLGPRTAALVAALRDELLGANTTAQIALMRDELLGGNTTSRVALLRDELLGATTRTALDSLVYSAVSTIGRGYRSEIRPIVEEEGSFFRKYATELLITAGVIVAALLVIGGIIWMKSTRYKKMLDMMTVQIDRIPDREAYDDLTRRIKEQAQNLQVEGELRKMLQKNGVQDDPVWKGAQV